MRIALASDHAGFDYKKQTIELLDSLGIEYTDFGPYSADSVDYPEFAVKVAQTISRSEYTYGILLCGTGIGMSIAANKIKGVRAALCYNVETARLSREHNNANILTLGARQIPWDLASQIIATFIQTPFHAEDRHERRVKKIHSLTQR